MKNVEKEIRDEITRMVISGGGSCSTPIIICDSYKIRSINDEIILSLIEEEKEQEYIPEKWEIIPFNTFVKVITKNHIYFAPRHWAE